MLYKTESGTERVQGYFIDIPEVEAIIAEVMAQQET